MNPTIDKNFNLVVTLEREGGGIVYVHSKPIPQEVFEQYHGIISRAFSEIHSGAGIVSAPRVAALVLRDIGTQRGQWEPVPGGDPGLLAHIRRLSYIIQPEGAGWGMMTLQEAVDQGVIDQEDLSEVDGVIAFFICSYAMHLRTSRRAFIEMAILCWSGQITSLSATAFRDSLPTSTGGASSGAKAASSVPR